MIEHEQIAVLRRKPFWRYCVHPDFALREGKPGFPFYTRRSALLFAREMADGMVVSNTIVFKRLPWHWRMVEDKPILTLEPASKLYAQFN